MEALIPVVVGFLLTAFFGNRLLHAWQTRTWMLQQRFLGKEKEYVALKELADEIASLLGVRIFRMRRLNRSLATGTIDEIAALRTEYEDALRRWNEKLASFYIRLPVLADYAFTWELEHQIQSDLVRIGTALERLVKERLSGAPSVKAGEPTRIEGELNRLQGKAIEVNKRLLHELKARRVDVYYGKRLKFTAENLRHFSTWQLIKALFVR